VLEAREVEGKYVYVGSWEKGLVGGTGTANKNRPKRGGGTMGGLWPRGKSGPAKEVLKKE